MHSPIQIIAQLMQRLNNDLGSSDVLPVCLQDAASAGSMGGMPSELAVLSVAANQLFQSTQHMGTEAVVCILTGLRSVSNRALPTAFQLPSHARCVSCMYTTLPGSFQRA